MMLSMGARVATVTQYHEAHGILAAEAPKTQRANVHSCCHVRAFVHEAPCAAEVQKSLARCVCQRDSF